MHVYPVAASEWIKFTPNNQAALKVVGACPVNDKILPFWHNRAPIWLFEGGRGGGKSEGVFDRLVRDCLEQPYFNAYYGRKVWDTVRDTCFQTLIDCIRKQGKEHLFKFSEANNSDLIVKCRINNNKFEPFGASNPESLKSIRNPSHIVCEEFDQFDIKDFQDLFPTLRTTRTYTEFVAMYNSWGVLPAHWINLLFFPELYTGDENIQFNALEGIEIAKIFINYTDNYFIDQEAYKSKLRLASAGNTVIFEALANGARGVIENNSPWLYAFNEAHIRQVEVLDSYPIYITFDFNANPLTCTLWQRSPNVAGIDGFLHAIDEMGGHQKLDDLCLQIRSTYPNHIFFITGDRNGNNEDFGRNQTAYQMIQSLLHLSDAQINTNTYNLEHFDSRLLCNIMFTKYKVLIDPCCTNLIADCRKAQVDTSHRLGSQLLKDREDNKMDYFDGMRYLFQTYYNDYIRSTYLSAVTPNNVAPAYEPPMVAPILYVDANMREIRKK